MTAAPQPTTAADLDLTSAQGCTLASAQRDFPEWHRGRPCFAVWAIAINNRAVDQRLALVRQALQPLLLPGDQRQAHITLHVCGFPVAAPAHADDFGAAQLQAQVDALARAAVRGFALRVGGAFSFASAACLAVHDDGAALPRLRLACQQAAPSHDATPYVPHVTAGLYGGAWPMRDVQARLQALATLPCIHLPVTSLDWMVYDSGRIGGALRSLLRVDLATGQAQITNRAAFDAAFDVRLTACDVGASGAVGAG